MRSDSSNVKTLCIETARPSESNPAPTLALVAGTVTVTIYPAPLLSLPSLLHGQCDLAAQHFDFLRDSGNIRRRGGIDQIGGLAVVFKDHMARTGHAGQQRRRHTGHAQIPRVGVPVREQNGVNWDLGMYMSGFFPCMMFGIPGAALAMVQTAKNKKAAIGLVVSAVRMAGGTPSSSPPSVSATASLWAMWA